MSGGVDSSVTAALLQQQGHEVVGITMKLWEGEQQKDDCCSPSVVRDAKGVADRLGIQHHTVDFQGAFAQGVIGPFMEEYQHARTPNPCIVCNQRIKFGAMLEKALELGADYVATGHYARVEHREGRHLLLCGVDGKKDQSYFLYRLTQQQLAHVMLPLWNVTKEETRRVAAQIGLSVADKKDSQEICFIPDGDYAAFIEGRSGKMQPGNFVDAAGNILGRHQGLLHYTVGQRKGLGIALGYPAYVLSMDPATNTVVLGQEGCQLRHSLTARDMNWIGMEAPNQPFGCTAKIRYNAKAAPCVVTPLAEGVSVVFEQPQRAVTPGQSVVFYQQDLVLGGGIIDA